MFSEVKNVILNSEKIAIFNHKNPDGDAFGSAYALKLALCSIGKKCEVFLRSGDETLPEYEFVFKGEKQNLKIDECDLLIAVDSSDIGRIADFEDVFKGNTMAIDHHLTHIPYAKTNLIVPDAAATGEIIYDVLTELKIEITNEIAHNIYVAISTDTGNFKFSSTSEKTHLIAAKLLKSGIDVGGISKMIYGTKSIEYLNMLKTAIEKLSLYANGKIAVLTLDKSDFDKCNIKESDASAIVTLPTDIKGVEVSIYIRKRPDEIKVSLRSNTDFDVSKIAAEFGGGGHKRASGFSLNDISLTEAEEKVLSAIMKDL